MPRILSLASLLTLIIFLGIALGAGDALAKGSKDSKDSKGSKKAVPELSTTHAGGAIALLCLGAFVIVGRRKRS